MNTDKFNRLMARSAPLLPQEVQDYFSANPGQLQQRLRVLLHGVPRWCESVLAVLKWQELHSQWTYDNKGIFPSIDLDKMLKERLTWHNGIATITEGNFYLDHSSVEESMQAQIKFMLEVVLPHMYEQHDPAVSVDLVLPDSSAMRLVTSHDWCPGVRAVSMDCGRWRGNNGSTVVQISDFSANLLHVEVLTRIAHAWNTVPPVNGRHWSEYMVIPGIRMNIDDREHALCIDWRSGDRRSIVIGVTPINEALRGFVIPVRLD